MSVLTPCPHPEFSLSCPLLWRRRHAAPTPGMPAQTRCIPVWWPAFRFRCLRVTRGEQDRHAVVVLHLLHLRPNIVACNGVHANRGLIEDQRAGPIDQGLRQFEAAHRAAGVLCWPVCRHLGQVHRRQQIVDPTGALATRHVAQPDEPVYILPAGQRGLDRTLLRDIARVVTDVHGVASSVQAEEISTWPCRGGIRVVSARTPVVLPAPLGASRPMVSPRRTCRLRTSTAVRSP